jgi:hypothetical protein
MIDWGLLVAPAAVLLVIPLAIVSAQLLPAFRRSTGSILVSGALATIVFAAYWLIFGGVDSLNRNTPANALSFYVGLLLTIACWILAINAAAQARRWLWVALIIASGYATFVAVYFSFTLLAFQNCFTGSEGNFTCPAPDPLRRALLIAGYLVCPVAALIFAVRAPGKRVRIFPDGLVVSSLRAEHAAEAPVDLADSVESD